MGWDVSRTETLDIFFQMFQRSTGRVIAWMDGCVDVSAFEVTGYEGMGSRSQRLKFFLDNTGKESEGIDEWRFVWVWIGFISLDFDKNPHP